MLFKKHKIEYFAAIKKDKVDPYMLMCKYFQNSLLKKIQLQKHHIV